MIKIYFVRHAQPEHAWEDDRTRPLTGEGKDDAKKVLEFLKDKSIDKFYCSPYKRSMDTIAATAEYYAKEIITDERLREREKGPNGNKHGIFQKRWADIDFHEEGGESIAMVQERNIAALQDVLYECSSNTIDDMNIVIGTHGTALSSILHYFDTSYNCDSFLRIIDWMPYIIELDFDNIKLIDTVEHLHVQKEFKGKERADKKYDSKTKYDCCIQKETQWFRYRAAAIIIEEGEVLFAKNELDNYYYTIGGGVHIGETSEEAVVREVFEETGIHYEVDRLAFINECFFEGDGSLSDKECHVIEFYYLMKSRGTKELDSNSYTQEVREFMQWLPIDTLDEYKVFPLFFKDKLMHMTERIEHFVSDERN